MNTNKLVIEAIDLGKKYEIGKAIKYLTLRDSVVALFRRILNPVRVDTPTNTIWALKHINFSINKGEVVGIIGSNGAGKSTLLKILSQITDPTVGIVKIQGRVASLLEVGTGFNLELTGRENIYLNGAILGMTKNEINAKFEEIVEFSGVKNFLDTPVKHYSSGMHMRLAFSVAAHLDSEILIIDEVLAVGDLEFQRKCLGKMDQLSKSGRTVLFVSHNIPAIQNLCSKVIIIDNGMIIDQGYTKEMIKKYLSLHTSKARAIKLTGKNIKRTGTGTTKFTEIKYLVAGKSSQVLLSGEDCIIELSYKSTKLESLFNVNISLGIDDNMGTRLFPLSTELTGNTFGKISPTGKVLVKIPHLPLNAGIYTLTLFMRINGEITDWAIGVCQMEVVQGDYYGTGRISEGQGSMLVDHSFEIKQKSSL